MSKRLVRVGLLALLLGSTIFGSNVLLNAAHASPSRPAVVSSGSGTGFVSKIITVANSGLYDFNFSLTSHAGYCAQIELPGPTVFESATLTLASSDNVMAANFTTGPLVLWSNPTLGLTVSGDRQVNLAAGNWTLTISWQCFNAGSYGSNWSYTIS
jgi:hypothetical protein